MRSRTSRGVPEWSEGKELYIGSAISAIGTSFGVTGIVPGPPEGSRGSTGWGHLSRRAPWAEVLGEPAPDGLVHPPAWGPPAPRVGNPRVGAPPLALGGKPPPWPPPPLEIGSPRAGAPLGTLYIVGGREGSRTQVFGASLSPRTTSPSRRSLAKPCRDRCCIHHHAVVLLDLHQPLLPPCWIKKEETSSQLYVC